LLDSAKALFYSCKFDSAKTIFKKINDCKSPNYEFIDSFLTYGNSSVGISVMSFKKIGNYELIVTINSPSLNHSLWFLIQNLSTGYGSDNIFNNPYYSGKEFNWQQVSYNTLANGSQEFRINYLGQKNRKKMRGEDGTMQKTRTRKTRAYEKRKAMNHRNSSYKYLQRK
jgi:hypothetical protein